jgi:outer membrane protein assembly factor BamB
VIADRRWGTVEGMLSLHGRLFVGCLAVVAGAGVASRAAVPASEARMLEADGEAGRHWTRWRGPSGQGLARGGPYADVWSPRGPFAWKVAVPGQGNSSPIVWRDRIFLTTAYDRGQRVALLCFRRSDGRKLWELPVPSSPGTEYAHYKNGYATPTPVTDGVRVYASFGAKGLLAAGLDGTLLWHQGVGRIDSSHGIAGSPVLYKDRVILYHDAGSQSFVGAFDTASGKPVWRTPRRESIGWGTPIVVRAGGRDELIVSSEHRVYGYDPGTGRQLWYADGNTWEVIPTPVVAHGLLFASSGRAGPTFAIRPGGAGNVTSTHVAWSVRRGSPFVPSGIVAGDVLYLVNDSQSILTGLEAKTGQVLFQQRLGVAQREGFSASPVAADGKVFFTNDDGETFVVKAGRQFSLLRVNQLDERVLASPALVEGTWYIRTASSLLAITKP